MYSLCILTLSCLIFSGWVHVHAHHIIHTSPLPPTTTTTTKYTTHHPSPQLTAMIAACGGLIIAKNLSIPYMPRLLIVKLPPVNSSGASLLTRALVARSLTVEDMLSKDKVLAFLTMGVRSPEGVATATHTSTPGGGVVVVGWGGGGYYMGAWLHGWNSTLYTDHVQHSLLNTTISWCNPITQDVIPKNPNHHRTSERFDLFILHIPVCVCSRHLCECLCHSLHHKIIDRHPESHHLEGCPHTRDLFQRHLCCQVQMWNGLFAFTQS